MSTLSLLFWNLLFVLLQMGGALAACVALIGGLLGLPVIPLRNYFAKAGAGFCLWMFLGLLLWHFQAATRQGGLGLEAVFYMICVYGVLAAWAVWLWPVHILGFFYSFTPHPAANAIDRYIADNEDFNPAAIHAAFDNMPQSRAELEVRIRQTEDMVERLHRETRYDKARLEVERLLRELKKARAHLSDLEQERVRT